MANSFADRSPARALAVADFDQYDPWGSTMGVLFAMSEALFRLGYTVPPELDYRPAPSYRQGEPPRSESFEATEWYYSISDGDVTVADTQHTARVLNRYCDLLRRHGRAY